MVDGKERQRGRRKCLLQHRCRLDRVKVKLHEIEWLDGCICNAQHDGYKINIKGFCWSMQGE